MKSIQKRQNRKSGSALCFFNKIYDNDCQCSLNLGILHLSLGNLVFESGRDMISLFALKYLVVDGVGGHVLSDTAFARFLVVLFSVFIPYSFS